MYSLMNKHKDDIVNSIKKIHVEDYDWLLDKVKKENVLKSREYRRRYKNYWLMKLAKLDEDYCDIYFGYLEDYKNENEADLLKLCKYLYNIPIRSTGDKSLQFSFATKLLHTINPHLPIYDSKISNFYYFRKPGPTSKQKTAKEQEISINIRISNYGFFYDFLKDEYSRILKNNLLKEAIECFKTRFSSKYFTDEKIVDSLIWAFVSYAQRENAFLIRKLEYS